jgi:5,10-methenyltetrahydrofolate synthetase
MPAFDASSEENRMRFHKIRKPIKRNVAKAGMGNAAGRTMDVRRLDYVMVPMMGFDAGCRRLGRGGGYYDRMLSFLRRQSRPRFLGMAWDFQKLERGLHTEPHDVPMDEVCTPRNHLVRERPVLSLGRYST